MLRLIKNILCLIISLLIFTACEKKIIDKYENKILGTWHFEKVTKNTTIGNSNNFHSRLWQEYQITFLDDNKVELYNNKNKESYFGTYVISKSNLEIDEDYPYYIDIVLNKNGEQIKYLWYFRNINNHTLKILEYQHNDILYYKLVKSN